jgi:hypothetical protein
MVAEIAMDMDVMMVADLKVAVMYIAEADIQDVNAAMGATGSPIAEEV